MKKIFALCIAAALIVSFSACSSQENNQTTVPTTNATTASTFQTEKPTEATEYKINIPYSCFSNGVPLDSDLIITNEDRSNGITNKEKVNSGGMIITVEIDKYEQLVEFHKNKVLEWIDLERQDDDRVTNLTYNDDFSEFTVSEIVYHEPSYSPDMAISVTGASVRNSHFYEIKQESIYYQAILKKDSTENITCTIITKDSETGELLHTSVYPEK